MNLKPISNHIILKSVEAEKVTASGIIIPETVNNERPEQAEVLAVGPGKILENGQRQTMEVIVGQKILFKKYAPDEVKLDNEKFLIISSDDVIAIIE